jgi:hypothetical protein
MRVFGAFSPSGRAAKMPAAAALKINNPTSIKTSTSGLSH